MRALGDPVLVHRAQHRAEPIGIPLRPDVVVPAGTETPGGGSLRQTGDEDVVAVARHLGQHLAARRLERPRLGPRHEGPDRPIPADAMRAQTRERVAAAARSDPPGDILGEPCVVAARLTIRLVALRGPVLGPPPNGLRRRRRPRLPTRSASA
ncbi:MAG: hypothetical protein R6V44_12245 [Paracoccaceae bacterium]